MQAHAGENFKFRIRRTGTYRCYIKIAVHPFLAHFCEIGNGIPGVVKILDVIGIKEGFQLKENDIGVLFLGGIPGQCFTGSIVNRLYGFLGVILGFVDTGVDKAVGQTVGKTVVFIGIGKVVEAGGKELHLNGGAGGKEHDDHHGNDKGQCLDVADLSL